MKKLFKVLLSLVMLLSLCACGEKTVDEKQLVIDAINKTSSLDYLDIDMDMNMNFMGMSIEMPISTKVVNENGVPIAMDMSLEMLGETMNMLFADGYMYMDTYGYKIKAAASMEEFIEYNGVDHSSYLVDETMIESVEKQDDGSYNVYLFEDAVNSMAGDVGSTMGTEESFTVNELSYNVTIEDGYLTVFKMSMNISTEAEGTAYDIDADITATYNNIGQSFEITAPSDADAYTEVDMSDLTE